MSYVPCVELCSIKPIYQRLHHNNMSNNNNVHFCCTPNEILLCKFIIASDIWERRQYPLLKLLKSINHNYIIVSSRRSYNVVYELYCVNKPKYASPARIATSHNVWIVNLTFSIISTACFSNWKKLFTFSFLTEKNVNLFWGPDVNNLFVYCSPEQINMLRFINIFIT